MSRCKLCGSDSTHVEYEGIIRDGGLGKYTKEPVKIYRCENCLAMWHDEILDNNSYYESAEYREALEGTTLEQDFYRFHDKDNLDKFLYTGTDIFRNKIIADIGCGCGSFLDFVSGAANQVVAIEPSEIYRGVMQKKGYETYAYASEALEKWTDAIDVVTSFDVIEHVEKPDNFMKDVYKLLKEGGIGIIGTPTETPVMRSFLGEIYDRELLFSTQHLWVLGEKNLKMMAQNAGFTNIKVKYFQRFGIDNFIGWIKEKKPKCNVDSKMITSTLNQVWKSELEAKGLSDYIVIYLYKE